MRYVTDADVTTFKAVIEYSCEGPFYTLSVGDGEFKRAGARAYLESINYFGMRGKMMGVSFPSTTSFPRWPQMAPVAGAGPGQARSFFLASAGLTQISREPDWKWCLQGCQLPGSDLASYAMMLQHLEPEPSWSEINRHFWKRLHSKK